MPRARFVFPVILAVAGFVPAQEISFARDVLPILSDRCFQCHGPDAAARKADLRLDDQQSRRTVVVARDPDRSELFARISATDDRVMPPRDSGLSLSPDEILTLRRWIEQGAEWSTHWAFAAPVEPPLPAVVDEREARNGIDRFVIARLDALNLQPNPPADPAKLLRRVTLDLTGLPPTPAEVDAFLADPSDAAYERVVDRLLGSAHYGERMAWPWLEAARYADTDGYQADPTRTAWPWRDGLVRALNDNQPFDDFTIDALAGDLRPGATQEQRLATGFLRNNAHNGEGGRIAAETRIENVFDRVETMATTWMGLTLECARCHDHKYDPISQRDYYRLFAFFDQTSETGGARQNGALQPAMRYVPDARQRLRLDEIERELRALDEQMFGDDPKLDGRQVEWERVRAGAVRKFAATGLAATLGAWQTSARFDAEGKPNEMFDKAFPPEVEPDSASWRNDAQLADGVPLALPSGQYTSYFRRVIESPTARRMTVSLGSDDAIKVWCNGEVVLANNVRRGVAPDQERAELRLAAGRNVLLVKIVNTGGRGGFYFREVDQTVADLPPTVARALALPAERRSELDRRALRSHYRATNAPGYGELQQHERELRRERTGIERSAVSVMVMDQLPPERHRVTSVLERGDYQQPREVVTRDTPAFLPPLARTARPDRLALARWLVSGDHPLTARVAVNRAWQTFFGRGLVATSEDFGRQGDRPTHPELLDWLAHGFVASGWDVKALHRLIVTSATYRQSATASRAAFLGDPHNVHLARSARPRLPAWMLRDQAFALGGLLVDRLGGPPVRPRQPAGIWAEATFGTITYRAGNGEDLRRRSLYTFWRRIVGPPVLFDTAARQTCVVRRSITNTPLHALTTLNATDYIVASRGLAERACAAAEGSEARIAWIFKAATARQPNAAELRVLIDRAARARAHYAEDLTAARALLRIDDDGPAPAFAIDELAACTVIASIVLNLDEVLTRP